MRRQRNQRSGQQMKTPSWRRYLRFWRPNVEADVDDELRFHLEMRERDLVAGGLTPDEAHRRTLLRFGSVSDVRESLYEMGHRRERHIRTAELVSSIGGDIVFALRQLVRNGSFTIAAVITLALGIGANAVIFGLVNAILLRPLPGVVSPDRLITVDGYSVAYPSYRDFRDANPALSDLAAFSSRTTAVSSAGRTIATSAAVVSGNYFKLLGIRASAGRLLLPRDDQAGVAPVAVLSESFAKSLFSDGVDPVGRTIDLNGYPAVVVGVISANFHGTELDNPQSLWLTIRGWSAVAPADYASLGVDNRGWGWLYMIGRLRDGASLQSATAAFNVSASRQEAAYPRNAEGLAKTVAANPPTIATDAAMPSVSHSTMVKSATIVLAVVAIVLLIACANVSNLLLARAMRRRREMAVRMAIGAGRGRMMRQLLTETLVLSGVAATIGLIGTMFANRWIAHLTLANTFSFETLGVRIDTRVTAFTILVALAASVVFGVGPALHGANDRDMTVALKDGAPGGGTSRSRLRRSLLVAQIALSLILLIGAGLFTRSLQRALAVDPGFDGSDVALGTINVGLIPRDSARASEIYNSLTRKLQSMPGVASVAISTTVPLDRGTDSEGFRLDDYIPPRGRAGSLELADVSPGYFKTFRIPLVRGRLFSEQDTPGALHAAIINQTMAHRYWNGRDPLGKRILFGGDTVTVVGVVRDSKYHELSEPAQPFVYRVLGQQLRRSGLFSQNISVRGSGNPSALIGLIRRAVSEAAPEVPLYDLSTFEESTGHAVFAQRLGAVALGLFGALAVIMTAVGIYGVVGYGVSQRTREMGVRIALGARARSVLSLILFDNLATIAIGLVIGVAVSALLTRSISGFLFGISPLDTFTFASSCVVLIVVGSVAALIPALRATRVDPAIALRTD